MALVRGSEVFAQVVVAAGAETVNRRVHRIEIHREGSEPVEFEGKNLPNLVYLNTNKNKRGQNVLRLEAAPKKEREEFSSTTFFIALIGFVGFCAFVIVRAIESHRCF